jgi:hypothetical protein
VELGDPVFHHLLDATMDVNALATGSRLAPWAALVAALSGEAAHHQVLSDMLRYNCRLGDPHWFLVAAVCVVAWMALGAGISWLAVRGESRASTRRFIANLGLLLALLLALAVTWQTFAGFIVPGCPT